MTEANKGKYWNEELGSWEFPYEGSLEQAIVEYMADPTEAKKLAYLARMEQEIEERIEDIARWQSEGGAK